MNYQSISSSNNEINKSLSKLSTGLRITQSSEDASGLGISDNLRTHANGLSKALDNASSAVAMAQIADKAMAEQSNILDVVKQKLLQASTKTTSNEGKQAILKDIKKLLGMYDAIASSTNYNGITLLQKSQTDISKTENMSFQVAEDANATISFGGIQANTSNGGIGQVDKIIISGDIKKYDVFAVNINNHPTYYVADDEDVGNTADKHNLVATKLMSKLLSSVGDIQIVNSASGELTITAETLGAYLTYHQGTATFDNSFSFFSDAHYPPQAQTYTMRISGDIESGDIFTIGGASYTVQNESSTYQVAQKLVTAINSLPYPGAIASVSSNFPVEIQFTASTPGSAFINPTFSTTNVIAISDQAITSGVVLQGNVVEILAQAEIPSKFSYDLTGTESFTNSDTYSLTIDGTTKTVNVTASDTRLSVLNNFKTQFESDTSLSGITHSITTNGLEFKASRSFVSSSSQSIDASSMQSSLTQDSTYQAEILYQAPQAKKVQYSLSGTVQAGDKFLIGSKTYTVQTSDATLENIVDKLVSGINGNSTTGYCCGPILGITASKDASGNLILTSSTPGIDFTTPSSSVIGVGLNTQLISQSTTHPPVANSYEIYDKYYSIDGIVKDGNTFMIGTSTYTVQNSDLSNSDIVDGLVKAVNGSSDLGVGGTPLSGVIARNESGKLVLRSIINPVPDFTVSSTNDMSGISVNELYSNISIDDDKITFTSGSNKYRQYKESLNSVYSDETQSLNRENISMADSLLVLKNLWELDVPTAQYFLSITDKALDGLNIFRSDYGSLQNQMESISRTLMTEITNTKYAESLIRDVDYASEVANLNKNEFVSQSASFTQQKIKERHQEIIKLIEK